MSPFVNLFNSDDCLCLIKVSSALIVTTISTIYCWFNRSYIVQLVSVIKRDLIAVKLFIKVKRFMSRCQKDNITLIDIIKENVATNPDHVVFVYGKKRFTIKEVDALSDKIAFGINSTIKLTKGDEIAVLITSSPHLVITWLALAKLGVISALIDTSVAKESLINNLEAFNCKCIIFSEDHAQKISDIIPFIKSKNIQLINYRINEENDEFNCDYGYSNCLDLDQIISDCESNQDELVSPPINFTDKLIYIFTSGTTGLPKASIITHHKFILRSSLNYFPGISQRPATKDAAFPGQIIYCPLPLHHSLAGTGVVSLSLIHCHTIVIQSKFSVNNYWDDILINKCSMIIYVGEMARYLLANKITRAEKTAVDANQVKVAFGVGLRSNLFDEFKSRFNLEHVLESYGATEANCQLVNLNSHPGACGFIPWILPSAVISKFYPALLITVDDDGEPIRDAETGLCVPVFGGKSQRPDLASDHGDNCVSGCFVSRISESDILASFEGYVSTDANERKIIKDVISRGDKYFISGDILIKDQFNYIYFKDRVGDTFRWKSENVSTTQIENIISKIISESINGNINCGASMMEIVAFGVSVPHHEGRAGMIAIIDESQKFDPNTILARMKESLPNYAIPNFVRVIKSIQMTESFKYKKNSLKSEAFNVFKSGNDPLYYLCRDQVRYKLLTAGVYERIVGNEIKF